MEEIKKELYSEIEPFREKGKEFLEKKISKMDFKGISGGMGVYAHKDQKEFMIRIRIPSGIIALDQLKQMYEWAKKFNLGGLHLTTRQAIQYHGLSIDEICDLMKEALDHNIYTRGAGGNFPRNVALSPLSGVEKGEAFDVTQYAVEVGNYFMNRITSYHLPRKLKVSFSNSAEDTAHCTIQDLGFMAVMDGGQKKFRVYAGGGLGRNPKLALIYPELIEPNEVLYYVEAMVEMFKAEGNYENKGKARIRYIVDKLGEEGFLECYKKHIEEAKARGGLDIECEDIIYNKPGVKIDIKDERLIEQKQEGLYSVYLHPIGGQISLSDIEKIIYTLETCKAPEIRLSMTEGVYFRNLDGNEAKDVLEVTKGMGGVDSFQQSISCIGVPTCQMGVCESQEVLREMLGYVMDNCNDTSRLPKVYFSGCGNSCGVHQVGEIGFTGKMKRVDGELLECFETYVDGCFKEGSARLGTNCGDILRRDIPEFMLDLAKTLNDNNECFGDYIKNNIDGFKEILSKYSA